MPSELTKRQKQVLQAIYKSLKDFGYPPTLSDLREELDVVSNQAVLDILRILENKKYIKREEGTARGIKLFPKAFKIVGLAPIVPYVGVSAAGPYTQAFEQNEWKVAESIHVSESDMIVTARGDSMTGAGIQDGDLVLVREAKEFKNGDVVLARNNDETTIKRFVHDDGKVYLKPENPKYKNIPIYPETRLLGKVVGILGKSKINL